MTFWLILWVVFLCVYYLLIYSFQSRSVFSATVGHLGVAESLFSSFDRERDLDIQT